MANGKKIYCRQFADVPQRVSVGDTLGYRRIRNGNHSGNTQISSDFSPSLWLSLSKKKSEIELAHESCMRQKQKQTNRATKKKWKMGQWQIPCPIVPTGERSGINQSAESKYVFLWQRLNFDICCQPETASVLVTGWLMAGFRFIWCWASQFMDSQQPCRSFRLHFMLLSF